MVYNDINTLSFWDSLEKTKENSLNLDNSGDAIEYMNKNLRYYDDNKRNLTYYSSWLIGKYLDEIKASSRRTEFNLEDTLKFDGDPRRLSVVQYGSTDFAYLILAVNNMFTPNEFTVSRPILLPDKQKVLDLIQIEENKRG